MTILSFNEFLELDELRTPREKDAAGYGGLKTPKEGGLKTPKEGGLLTPREKAERAREAKKKYQSNQ